MRHFVLVLHSHMLEIRADGSEGPAPSEDFEGFPLAAPRIHVWARTPDGAVEKIEERLSILIGDKECRYCGECAPGWFSLPAGSFYQCATCADSRGP